MAAFQISLDHQTAITACFYATLAANVVFFVWLTKGQSHAKRRRERLFGVATRTRKR